MGYIAGIVDGAAPTGPQLARLLTGRLPQGPVDDFTLGEPGIALAGDPRPLRAPDGRHLLAFTGHLDNAEELRHRYGSEFPFASTSDAEVALAALALDGQASLPRLSGAFALFLWDRERQQGFAARDRLGVKSLFWAREGGALRFSSSVQGLRAPAADLEALVEWALVPGLARVGLQGVEVLPPGGLLEVRGPSIEVRRWHRLRPPARPVDDEAVLDDVMRRVYVSTSTAAASTGRTAVLLSGGLVSSLVTSVAGFMHEGLLALTLDTDDAATRAAAAVCTEAEVEHQVIPLSPGGFDAIEPTALPLSERDLGQQQLLRAAAERTERVLVGDAASVLHFGLSIFGDAAALASPAGLLEALKAPPRLALLAPALRDRPWLAQIAARLAQQAEELGLGWGSAEENAQVTRGLLAERAVSAALHVREAQARAAAIQVRVPFAATELVELAARVRPALALRDGQGMWHLRHGLRGEVPDAVCLAPPMPEPAVLTDAALRVQALRVLQDPRPLVSMLLDLSRLRAIAEATVPLTAIARGGLLAAVALASWAERQGLG
jgi:asparagine synthase (glutamine-hydrolysing)